MSEVIRNADEVRICTVEDCARPHAAHGLCKRHYASWRSAAIAADGRVMATGKPRKNMSRKGKLCETGCGRPVHARGYCHSCYKTHAPRKPCATEGCGKKMHAQGLCDRCYMRAYSSGLLAVVRPINRPIIERFSERLAEPNAAGCVIWTGTLDRKSGRGTFTPEGGVQMASHRFAYKLANGELPVEDGKPLPLDHMCRVPLCTNAEHLQPVTPAENTRRGLVAAGHRNITSDDGWFWIALNAWRHGADNFPDRVVTTRSRVTVIEVAA